MSSLEEFKKLLKEAVDTQKKVEAETAKIVSEEIDVNKTINSDPIIESPKIVSEETVAEKAARYLNTSKQNDNVPAEPKSIEPQRWNDPLRVEKNEKFVTFKEMNDHYSLFLQRIQQQMSTIGGGGEVNFRGLDDVLASSTGTNKFLTYDPTTRKFYFDFFGPATESAIGGIIPGPGFTVETDGTLGLNAGPSFYLDETDTFRLRPGSADLIGGIKAGPGVAIDPDGTLFIDSSGVPFTFGDFTGLVGQYSSNTDYALLGSINEDEDIVIASNGQGGIKVVGEFRIYSPNGTVTNALENSEPYFQVKRDGQVQILVPLADTTEGGVEIIGSELGTSLQPGIAGTMLHLTGNANLPTRVYHDSLGEYSSYVFRRYNGSVISPTQVLADEAIGRINFTAATNAGMGNVASAQIRVNATEDQTTTAQGSEILLFVTPEGSSASNRISALEVRASGITSSVGFIGNLTGVADTANTVSLVATNSTSATHYITFVDSATGNENIRTDTDLTYNPGTSTFSVPKFSGKYIRNVRDLGVIADGGTVTIDFSLDGIVKFEWDNNITIGYSNYTAGSVVKVIAFKRAGTGTDNFNLDGITPGHVSTGSTTVAGTAGQANFVEFTCIGTTIDDVYAKI